MSHAIVAPETRNDNVSPSPSLRERAEQLAPAIAERAQQVDEMRHVNDDSIAEMVDAGLTRAMLPAAYGGAEASPEEFIGAVVEISKACASTGWVLCILGMHNWEMAHMSTQLQEELYGKNPDTLLSSSYAQQGTARRVDGGYVLNGRWRSSSGVHHASYAVIGADVHDGDLALAHNFVVPLGEVEVIDDWYTLGLCGTGSRSIVAEELFVPEYRTIDRDILLAKAGPGLRENTAAVYQVPQGLLYTTVGGAPAIGAGWGFYEEFKRQIKRYTRRVDEANLGADRPMLLRLADARGTLGDQEESLLGHMREAYGRALAQQAYTPIEVAEGIFEISRCARAAVGVAHNLMPLLTAGVVYKHNPLQRIYRDLLTARQHGTQNVDLTGATLANLEMGNEASALFLLTPERLAAAQERAARLYG